MNNVFNRHSFNIEALNGTDLFWLFVYYEYLK